MKDGKNLWCRTNPESFEWVRENIIAFKKFIGYWMRLEKFLNFTFLRALNKSFDILINFKKELIK